MRVMHFGSVWRANQRERGQRGRATRLAGLAVLSAALLGCVLPQVASASGPPSVETKAALGITETYATLHGTVNPNGAETKYYFEYGTSESYGSETGEASAGSGTSSVEESALITGLKSVTWYYFRIVARNSFGTTHGVGKPFRTAPF